MRLRTSLILLSLATALPLVVFALLAAAFVVEHENENFVSVAKSRNRAMIAAVDAVLRDTINTLRALSAASSIVDNDLEAFDRVAKQVLATQPYWNNVLLHDAQGHQLANASLPWGTPLPDKPVAPRSIEAAVRTLRPAIDDLTGFGPLLQNRLGVPVRVPVVRDGKVAYVLTAVLDPEALQGILVAQNLPKGWVSGLVDNNGRLIARVPATPPGAMASQDYLDHSRAADEGWYRGKTLEGKDTYTAFLRSNLAGWTIGYAVPAALVSGGAVRAAWLMGAGIVLSLAVAAAIGLLLSRRIARPMSKLADAAAVLGAGTRPAKVASTIYEVERLSTALSDAASAIERRDDEVRRSEAGLRAHAEELRRANANKSQFLALLSHELRNPLAPLRYGLALLKMRRDPQVDAETQAMMERQVEHLTRLIDDLLDVSRIDRGLLELRRERVAVEGIVKNGIETARPAIEAKQQELVVRLSPEPLYVEGDPVRLSQVVSNLVNNAAKFSPAGGRIEVMARLEDGDAVLSVNDTGIGFSPDQAERIFDMFVQLDPSRSHAAGGLGIGLTIVRSLVEMHGGRIEAQSAGPGTGATFTVRLPRVDAPAQAETLAPSARPAHGRRILVVDDNADAADSLAEILRLERFDVGVCYDGARALELARAYRPDVAFLDLNLPSMSGTELAAALRNEPWADGLRLIALTGMGQKSDIEATRAAGFHEHLAKPASPDEILRLASGSYDNVIPLRAER
jgi:signal transduction histidine kinase/ActR/RegA family two-component response regulator